MRALSTALLISLTLAGCGAGTDSVDDFSSLDGAKADAFSKKMKLIGALHYGDSQTAQYHNPPRYLAFTFQGAKGDAVDVTVSSANGAPALWILTSRFRTVASGNEQKPGVNELKATLSAAGQYYIVVRDQYLADATFTVQLAAQGPDYYSCHLDSDCVAIAKGGCCPNGYKVAVNQNEVSAYQIATACVTQQICPLYVINDTRVAECNHATQKCEMVNPTDISCGGFIVNAHACPAGYQCVATTSPPIPDLPGKCQQTCVDNVLCIQGSHWDSTACKCVPN